MPACAVRAIALGAVLTVSIADVASAQAPATPYPYGQAPAPYPYGQAPTPYPYGQAPAPYPPAAPSGVPPQPGMPLPGYAPMQPMPAPMQPPPPVLQPPPPVRNPHRSEGEMGLLLGTSAVYGIGTGIWLDALTKTSDPGIAVIAPAAFGAAVPVGLYLWDQADEFDRTVPSTMATGLLLGAVEGVAIDGLQWQATGNGGPNSWDFRSNTTAVFLASTAGGIGGYAFGEWLQPDPRSLAFIASGAGWGSITGVLFGSGVVNRDWKDGAAPWGFAGYNLGIVATGALSTFYTPSWQTIKYLWLGQVLGVLATTPVYLFYIDNGDQAQHGLIANAVGGLAGLALAAVFTAGMSDPPGSASSPLPFQLALAPTPRGGMQLTASGLLF